jgi:hypothetical protein
LQGSQKKSPTVQNGTSFGLRKRHDSRVFVNDLGRDVGAIVKEARVVNEKSMVIKGSMVDQPFTW